MPDATFDALHKLMSDEDILELGYHVMCYNLHAVLCKAMRLEFDGVRGDAGAGVAFLLALRPLSDECRLGPFEDGSLFVKTLAKIVNDRRQPR